MSHVTVRRRGVIKEVTAISNKDMLLQLIAAFGVCVVSSVRKRFPAGQNRYQNGSKVLHSVQTLKKLDAMNSIIVLLEELTPSCQISYLFRRTTRGVDLRYEPYLKKLIVSICYIEMKSTDSQVASFYSNYAVEKMLKQQRSGSTQSLKRLIVCLL